MVQQRAILLALSAGLFDAIPLGKMGEAERAVCEAADQLSPEHSARLESADALADEDRTQIVDLARQVLAQFLPADEGSE